jgi:hypothetical protein
MQELITQLLETDRHHGEIAYGPGFVLDLRLLPTPEELKQEPSSEGIYDWLEAVYPKTLDDELKLGAAHLVDHLENINETLDYYFDSDVWDTTDDDREITREAFLPWLQECFLAEESYEGLDGENPYADQVERLMMFASWVAPELFGESSALMIHSLTDVNNENTPYGVFVAIGPVNTLVVVTCWML